MNYFHYFSEIEERFQRRRGSILMLSTLDWALIETWREAGVPLEAVLRGIDTAFDKHDARTATAARHVRKVNGLAWCAQAVMEAVEEMQEAAAGGDIAPEKDAAETGFEAERVVRFLERNAAAVESAGAAPTALRLRELAAQMRGGQPLALDDLDRTLTVLEEKLFAELLAATPEQELVALRAEAERELAPYRGKMQAVQIRQVQQQFLHKKLLASRAVPRLSLFYMGLGE